MGLDIRIPLGLLFLITGGILSVYGLFTRTSAAIYEKSMGINLNLTWGVIMFAFGLIMFLVGRRQKWQDDPITRAPGSAKRRPNTKPPTLSSFPFKAVTIRSTLSSFRKAGGPAVAFACPPPPTTH